MSEPEKQEENDPVAEHIRLLAREVERVTAQRDRLREAVRFLWDAWSEAEGSGQPEAFLFGDPTMVAYYKANPEEQLYRLPSAEVQQAIRNALDHVTPFKVYKG